MPVRHSLQAAMASSDEFWQQLQKLSLCLRCQSVFCGVDQSGMQTYEELGREVNHKIRCQGYEPRGSSPYCLCCLNSLDESQLERLADTIAQQCKEKETHSIRLEISLPPVLDAFRVLTRGLVCLDINSGLNFPTFEAIMAKVLVSMLRRRAVVPSTHSKWIVTISADLPKQAQLLQAIDPSFKPKRLKRKAWEVDQLPLDLDSEPLTRASIDTHLKLWKSLRKGDLLAIMARTKHLYEQAASDQVALLKPRLKIHYTPIYLYGRYCKYARDVSQSPWALAADSGGGGEGDDPDDLRSGPSQKGRGSVEDIIGQAVRDVLGAEQVKLHGCGREDIDVRCLGNGRPFALEILQSQQAPSPERIQNIFRNINTRQGGNKAGDVSLTQLQESNVTLWETMQVEAEEKDKRYCCLVWTSRPVTAAELRTLEEQSNRSVDPTQRPCVQIVQKTPLRVLHRRSLIDRPRYVYNIQTARVHPNFFIMDLDTSAGTYVKEFVHGDLGRTSPSIASLLNCQAEILQLDVTWLYDSFAEQLPISPEQLEAARGKDWLTQFESDAAPRLEWNQLRSMAVPKWKTS